MKKRLLRRIGLSYAAGMPLSPSLGVPRPYPPGERWTETTEMMDLAGEGFEWGISRPSSFPSLMKKRLLRWG